MENLCQCTDQAYPFVCPRYEREMHKEVHQICQGCFLPEQRASYVKNWEAAKKQKTARRLDLTCPHRGRDVGTVDCPSCQGGPKAVFNCGLHERCVLMANHTTRRQGIQDCFNCPDLPENQREAKVNRQPTLSVTMVCYDDYEGAWMTVMGILLYHPEVLDRIEILVGDNNPTGKHGQETKKICESTQHVRYVEITEVNGSSLPKDRVIRQANGKFILHLDCHVLLPAGVIAELLDFYDENPHTSDLIMGPILHRPGVVGHTHQEITWRGSALGIWAKDNRGVEVDGEPFEIPQQGTGLFSCRKDAWLGFNDHIKGYGGCETLLMEKYRLAGHRVLCLPFLRWLHRFGRPLGAPYDHGWPDRVRNYAITHGVLNWEMGKFLEHLNAAWGSPTRVVEEMKKFQEEFPLVTAVMVTGGPARERLARQALEDFLAQEWPNKELLVVNWGKFRLNSPDSRVREIQPPDNLTLGDLRNFGLDNAQGDWLIGWDDDDRYGPTRISEQMAVRQPGCATTLRFCTHYGEPNHSAFVQDYRKNGGVQGSILHPKTDFRYQSLPRGEDSYFLRQFKIVQVENDPLLYVRRYHGKNTWHERHVMKSLAGVRNNLQLSREQQRRLRKRLGLSYYNWLMPLLAELGGNVSFAIPPQLLEALADRLEAGMKTLEFGSGLSTLLFDYFQCDHLALEHNAAWAEKIRTKISPQTQIQLSTLVEQPNSPPFYEAKPEGPFELILVDGPIGEGNRHGFLNLLDDLVDDDTVIFVDDLHRAGERDLAEEISRRTNKELKVYPTGLRAYGVIRRVKKLPYYRDGQVWDGLRRENVAGGGLPSGARTLAV